MNERIFELVKQADLIQWDTLPSGARTPDHESVVKAKKFAELIIQECLLAISKTPNLFTEEETAVMVKCHNYVGKHFGDES
jgi:hypothetical protein